MKKIIFLVVICLATIAIWYGCSGKAGHVDITRESALSDPPYFESINWPEMCTELPEGRLVISGTVVFPGGYDPDRPIQIFVFTDFSDCWPTVLEGKGKGGLEKEEITEPDPLQSPNVQKSLNKVLDYLANSRKGQANNDDFPAGCQRYCIWLRDNPIDNNDYSYFHPEGPNYGRFRLDFDQWCRFTPQGKILILVAVDAEGQVCSQPQIYRVPQYCPEAITAAEGIRHAYGAMMSEFGQGMLDVLQQFYPERSVDIGAIFATKNLYEQAYMGIVTMSHYRTIGEAYGQQMDLIAENITNPIYRNGFLYVAHYIRDEFIFTGDSSDAAHFQHLFAEQDPIENFWRTLQVAEDFYNAYPITVQRQNLPNDGLEVTIDILNGANQLAHIVMTGYPTAPLLVEGNIGAHTIVEDDYNPYFIRIFKLLFEANFYPCISY